MTQGNHSLARAAVGSEVRIHRISDEQTMMQALRFGLGEGARIRIIAKPPGGPVVLGMGPVEIALGRALCEGIEVEPA
jgi:Fe2+ transport system protein FeoA